MNQNKSQKPQKGIKDSKNIKVSSVCVVNTYGTLAKVGPLHSDSLLLIDRKIPRSQSERRGREETGGDFLPCLYIDEPSLLSDGDKNVREVGQKVNDSPTS